MNDGGSAGYPCAKLLRGQFAAKQIRAHQWISKQLLIVTQVTEQVLDGDLPSRLRICFRHVVPFLGPPVDQANWEPDRTARLASSSLPATYLTAFESRGIW